MKRVLAIILCLLCTLFLLVACGDGDNDTDTNTDTNTDSSNNNNNNTDNQGHTHTFKTNEDWSKDAQGHWYDATCDCEDVTITKLNHTDANNDGACDVCAYTNHEHEYSEEWTADCTNHWNAADCGHTVAGINVAAHEDENKDGRCDVCNYIIKDIHEHYYSTEWTTDGEYHWHAALCEHKVEVLDKAAHNVNAAGFCTVCDAKVKDIDRTNIEAVLAAAIANNYKVVTGNVIAGEFVYGAADAIENGKTDEVYFILGNDDSFITFTSYDMTGVFIGVDQYWVETLENGELFGVQIPYYKPQGGRNEQLEMFPVSGDAHMLNGYNYTPGGILAAGYDDNTTLAQTIANLYDILVKNVNVLNAESKYDAEKDLYSFSYNFFTVNKTEGRDEFGNRVVSYYVEYFDVAVEFTVNDDFVIDVADFTVKSYRNLEGVDEDISYDPDTNTVTMLPEANATVYTYSVAQTSGERTYNSIYPKASLVPQGFEIYTGTAIKDPETLSIIGCENKEIIGEILKIKNKDYYYIFLGDPYPVTSSFSFLDMNDIKITWVNNNPEGIGQLTESEPWYSWSGNFIGFMPKDDGVYTLTINIGEATRSVVIEVGEGKEIIPPSTDTTIYIETTDTYNWEQDSFTYTAKKSGKYTFNLPAGLGICIAGQNPSVDFYDNNAGEAASFDIEAGESVTFFVASIEKKLWTITVDFAASDVGGDDEGGDGPTYDYATVIVVGSNTLYFSQDEISANTALRPLTITVDGNHTFKSDLFVASIVNAAGEEITKNSDHTFDLVAGEYTVTFSMFTIYGTAANRPQRLTLVNNTVPDEGGDEGDDSDKVTLSGTYVDLDGTIKVEFNEDGTVVFIYSNPYAGESTLNATYEIADNIVTLYDENGDALNPYAASITLTDGVPTSAGYNGWNYNIFAEGSLPEAPKAELVEGENDVPVTGTSVMTEATINATADGVYSIVVGENAVVIKDGWYTYTAGQIAAIPVMAGDSVKIEVNSEDYTAGTVKLTVSFTPKAEDEPAKDALEGTYKSEDYTVELTRDYDSGVYYVTLTTADNSVCLRFTYTLTDNGDNSYTLSNLVNVPNEWSDAGKDKIDEIIANGITFSIDPMKEAFTGTSAEIDGYTVYVTKVSGEYLITITDASWSTTLYFTYTITDNKNGTFTFNQTYVENVEEYGDKETHLSVMESLDITINYDAEKEELNYYEYTGIEGYTLTFMKLEGVYYANVYNSDYSVDIYFTYTIEAGMNGEKEITLTYAKRDNESGADQEIIDAIVANTIVIDGLEG